MTQGQMTILVTGAAGFIGSAVSACLTTAGHRVVAFDNLSRGRREYLPPGTALIEADIRDAAALRAAISEARPDAVVHLAAMHFIPDCIARPAETIAINVDGTRNVLDACRGTSVRHVVFASSAAVYAPVEHACTEAGTPIGPIEIYGESKVSGEVLLEAFHAETGASATALRLFNAVGRRETNPHVIPHIFDSLKRSDVVPLGNTDARRDYVDSRDVASAMLAVLERVTGYTVMNVGTGVAVSVSDLIDELRRVLGRDIRVLQEAARMRPTERMLLLADTTRLHDATGWQARYALSEVLTDLCDEGGLLRAGG
ncbi:MAG: NAD-dependent epimerase/dehydratase family protein [Vicinamibacterales bacterium]